MAEQRNIDDEIAEQLEIIRKANERLSELTKEKGGFWQWPKHFPPTYPPYLPHPHEPDCPPFVPMPQWPMDELAPKCGTCGMQFTGPMGYVCPRGDCPSKITCDMIAK